MRSMRPFSSCIVQLQRSATARWLWLTNSTVRPLSMSCFILWVDRWRNDSSPTPMISSIRRISGSSVTMIENASLIRMPLE